ncbi:molybdenum cofactor biosynthesis protein MoaE [Sinomonas halotolerans]|uniref:Molybdenum cofactor biosynthesis protein MoaE n=1 Tax=Sinomonas halotolerans TaxID=1644133 RepID=A0ABU9WVG3_9MICC
MGTEREDHLDASRGTASRGTGAGGTEAAGPGFVIVHAAVTTAPLSEAEARAGVDAEDAGAVVLFAGVVRDHDEGRAVTRLAYTAHPTAQAALGSVVRAVTAEHAEAHGGSERPVRIWIAHRVGELAVGDAAFVCAVSAAHRGEAFRLCSDLVDRVKAEVPIWKEQFFDGGGSEWVAALG